MDIATFLQKIKSTEIHLEQVKREIVYQKEAIDLGVGYRLAINNGVGIKSHTLSNKMLAALEAYHDKVEQELEELNQKAEAISLLLRGG